MCAGVSALRPLLEVAGITAAGEEAGVEDVQRTIDVANAALRSNFTGPLVSAVSFVRQAVLLPSCSLTSCLDSSTRVQLEVPCYRAHI